MLPGFQIGRGEEGEIAALAIEGHDPSLGRRVPDDLGIAVLRSDVGQDRIARELGPGSAAIVAVGEALSEWLALRLRRGPAGGGVKRDQRRLGAGLKSAG